MGERHDGDGITERAIRHIQGQSGKAYAHGVLALDMVSAVGAVTTYYLWVDTSGKLRIAGVVPAISAAGDISGTVVGSQAA